MLSEINMYCYYYYYYYYIYIYIYNIRLIRSRLAADKKARKLKYIARHYDLPVVVRFDHSTRWRFRVGQHLCDSQTYGPLQLCRTYTVSYLRGNAIHAGDARIYTNSAFFPNDNDFYFNKTAVYIFVIGIHNNRPTHG